MLSPSTSLHYAQNEREWVTVGEEVYESSVMCTQLPGLDPAKAYRSLAVFGKEILPAMKQKNV